MARVPALSRTGWLAVVAILALAVGLLARWTWPSSAASLACAPADIRFDGGVAYCAPGSRSGPVPAGPALTLGVKLDLNLASAEELGLLPGIGPALARAILQAKTEQGGAFHNWDEVDQIPGIGAAKLATLQSSAEIR